MVFGGGMALAMPYLIKNIDPESLQELKEHQAKMPNVQNALAGGTSLSTLLHAEHTPKTAPGAQKKVSSVKNKSNKRKS
ncbi:hypothetical protein AX17_000675 [Amanita inopinata Kibby_2008]|nr:hypothetical protein AX17_000675 [Amanita inopinata Kibby_2008]